MSVTAMPFGDFICPKCAGALHEQNAEALMCVGCGQTYPVMQGVPLLLPGMAVSPGPPSDNAFISEMAHAALPGQEADIASSLRELFATRVTFPDEQLASEGHRFVHRLRSSGHRIRNPDGTAVTEGDTAPAPMPADTINQQAQVTLRLLTLPPKVIQGQRFGLQVRITNTGPTTLSSQGPNPFNLSYFARSPEQQEFREGGRTPLLIDLPPGAALTMPVFIDPPPQPGQWVYQITPVVEGIAWLHDPAIAVKIEILPTSTSDPLTVDWPRGDTMRDYGQDHLHGIALLNTWLAERLGGRTEPRILELGGNAAPQIADYHFTNPRAKRFNLDIDPFGLVFGTLQRRIGGGENVIDLLGDGTQLPFADGSLDAIVMFATMHHFPDPVGLLRHLKTKLAPGGLICVLCEPMGHVTRETLPADFRDELLGGICEQAFEAWEYRQFFHAAGLKIAYAMWDTGSLKVAVEAAQGEIEDPVRTATIPAMPVNPASPRPSGMTRMAGFVRRAIGRDAGV